MSQPRTKRAQHILGVAGDLALDFLVYGRRGDEDLPPGEVEEAVRAGELSVDDIVEAFRRGLREKMP